MSPNECCFKRVLFLLMSLIIFHKISRAENEELAKGRNGIVATDDKQCSKIGLDILIKGGHAVDAAVAATLCLGVKLPTDSGLGGGGFMVVRSNKGITNVYDMREMAPGGALEDMYKKIPNYNGTGVMSIAIPGQLAGLYTAHKKYGMKPWAEVVKPARDLATNGVNVSEYLYQRLAQIKIHVMADKELKRTFAPNGELLVEGKSFRTQQLAKTLSLIEMHGMQVFYNGSVGKSLVADIQKENGIITLADLRKYEVKERKPLVAHISGYKIITAPPPASGGAIMIMILKILSAYKNKDISLSLLTHRTIEALKFALARKANLGDPDFVSNKELKTMISTKNAEKIKNQIKDNQIFDSSRYGSKWSMQEDEGTTHIVVVDKWRNVVTMTTSINRYNGSRYMSPKTGIILNNHMHDFSYPVANSQSPAPANFIKPFKRPLSSMTPTILLKDGHVNVVIGSAGGLLIPDAVTQVLINHFHLKMGPQKAMDSPRFYHKLHPNIIYYETHMVEDQQILDYLRKKGHVLQEINRRFTTVCQLVIQDLQGPDSGLLVGVSDTRKGGIPAAY